MKNPKNDKNGNFSFDIDNFYKKYLEGPKIFKNREALDPSFVPDELPHRNNEVKEIAGLTACALAGDVPPNFLCYGNTGTGKTATIRFVSQKLANHCTTSSPWWIYINCNVVSTPYRVLAHIYNTISRKEKIPPTGLPKDIIFKKLLGLMDIVVNQNVCFLVLDEIDILIEKKGGNEILYDLTRLNENLDTCRVSVIGISNKLKFMDFLDPRVRSSLGQEELIFHPYNANELADILAERSAIAFHNECIDKGVIRLCAGLAAKEHGDARKALQLLRKAGEITERHHRKLILEDDVAEAQAKIESDHVFEYILGMPLQAQLALLGIYLMNKYSHGSVITSGDVYEIHSELTNKLTGIKQLTRRRISDYINELVLAGIITASTKSMGHYGRTKIIKFDVDIALVENALHQIKRFKMSDLLKHKPIILQTNKVKVRNNVFKKLL